MSKWKSIKSKITPKWPHAVPSLTEIEEAGFTWIKDAGNADSVICRSCGLWLRHWGDLKTPLEEHTHRRFIGLPSILKCGFLTCHPAFQASTDPCIFDPDGDVRLMPNPKSLAPTISIFQEEEDFANTDKHCMTARDRALVHLNLGLCDGPTIPRDHIHEEPIMLVSSRHLMLASPVFKTMLQPKFAEGLALRRDGKVDITVFDDDHAALQILFNIIHGRTRKIPETINMKMLTMFLVLVDKYETHEFVETYTSIWFNHLKDTIPRSFTADLYPWLCICWVLKKTEFQEITRIAQFECAKRVDEHKSSVPGDLPVPIADINAIAKYREDVIGGMLEGIDLNIKRYQGTQPLCKQAYLKPGLCDSLTSGEIIKFLTYRGLWPLSKAPYRYSVLCFRRKIQTIKITTFCSEIENAKAASRGPLAALEVQSCHNADTSLQDISLGPATLCIGIPFDTLRPPEPEQVPRPLSIRPRISDPIILSRPIVRRSSVRRPIRRPPIFHQISRKRKAPDNFDE